MPVHVHVPRPGSSRLPAAGQPFADVAVPPGGPPGPRVPWLDVQFDAVNALQGQAPPRDGIQGRRGVMAAPESSTDPVTRGGPALAEIPQPKPRLPDRFAGDRVADREPAATPRRKTLSPPFHIRPGIP